MAHIKTTVVVLSSIAVLALPPAAGAASWGRTQTLSSKGKNGLFPRSGVDARGGVVTAWDEATVDAARNIVAGSGRVRVALASPGRRFGRPQTFPQRKAHLIDLDVGGDGTAVLLYTVGDQCPICAPPVMLAHRSPGKPFGREERLPTALAPGAGVDDAGNVTVAWIAPAPNRHQRVVAAQRTGRGRYSRPVKISGPGAANLRIAVGPSGDAVAAWSEPIPARPGALRLAAAYRRAGRGWSNVERLTNGAGMNGQTLSVDVNRRGDAIVAWGEFVNTGTRMRAVRRTRARRFGAPQTVADNVRSTGEATLDPQGDAVATFTRLSCDACGFDFTVDPFASYARRGGTFGPPEAAGPAGGQADVAFDGSGTAWAVAAPLPDGSNASPPRLTLRSRKRSGRFGAPTVLARSNFVALGGIAMNARGAGAVTWVNAAPVSSVRVRVRRP
jgi:hypothetical protein